MLFDDNFDFMAFGINNVNNFKKENKSFNLEDSKTAFLKGNSIKDEYKPYKNFTYRKLNVNSKKEQLMLEIMELCFIINDLNLLLDLNPNDEYLNTMFKEYVVKSYEKQIEFVKLYGPLEVKESDGETFEWINNPWPWDNEGGSMYV